MGARLLHATVGHPPTSCCGAALSPACLLPLPAGRGGGSARAGQELPRPSALPARAGRARVAGATHTPVSPSPLPCQRRGSRGAALKPGKKGRSGLCHPVPPTPRGAYVFGGVGHPGSRAHRRGCRGAGLGAADAPNADVGLVAASCPCSGTCCPGTAAPTGAAPLGAWRAWTSLDRPSTKGTPHPLTRARTTASGTQPTAPFPPAPSPPTVPSPSALTRPPPSTLASKAPASPLTGATWPRGMSRLPLGTPKPGRRPCPPSLLSGGTACGQPPPAEGTGVRHRCRRTCCTPRAGGSPTLSSASGTGRRRWQVGGPRRHTPRRTVSPLTSITC